MEAFERVNNIYIEARGTLHGFLVKPTDCSAAELGSVFCSLVSLTRPHFVPALLVASL